MNDLFFIDYEAKVMLSDAVGLRPDSELAHRRLCDFIWATGKAPQNSPETLQEIGRVKPADWPKVKAELETKGWYPEKGLYTHKGCIKTLDRCKEKHARKVAASAAANAARWPKITPSKRTPNGHPTGVQTESQSQSQSQSPKERSAPLISGAQIVLFNQELERISNKMKIIKENYADHQAWTDDDRTLFNKMAERKKELKTLLGVEF
jgi:uncharacterized protein YdaU (DUF1376 family)